MTKSISKLKESENKGLMMQLFALFLVCGLMTYATINSDKDMEKLMPESRVFASSYNLKPSGLSALFELLEKVNHGKDQKHIRRWEKPYRKLKGGQDLPKILDSTRAKEFVKPARGTLLIVRPDKALADYEVQELLDWVKEGNTLVYLDDFRFSFSRRMLDKVGMGIERINKKSPDGAPSDDIDWQKQLNNENNLAALYSHLHNLKLTTSEGLIGGQALAKVDGHTIIAQKNWGRGRLLISTAPSMVSNKFIAKNEYWGNFQFLYNWLSQAEGDIIFDERCHGFKPSSNVLIYFLRGPAGYVTWQILILLGIGIVSTHQRFGKLQKLEKKRRIADSEYIDGLSNTYARAKARQAALEIIYQQMFNRLAKKYSVSPHEGAQNLIDAINKSATTSEFSSLAVATIQECSAQSKELSDADFLRLTQACDKILRSLNEKKEK